MSAKHSEHHKPAESDLDKLFGEIRSKVKGSVGSTILVAIKAVYGEMVDSAVKEHEEAAIEGIMREPPGPKCADIKAGRER